MANFGNLKQIYDEARANSESPSTSETLSRQLRDRVQVATWKAAADILAGTGLPALPNPLPPNPSLTPEQIEEHNRQVALVNETRSNLIGWAQRVIEGDPLKIVLALEPAATSKADLQNKTDEAVRQAVAPAIPLLAKGAHPGR